MPKKRAPPACGSFSFRHLPDALERAAELDATYGRRPDLDRMPLYGVVFSFKDSFDTKDMRTTGGADAAYDIDFPARDHVLVDQLRQKGAIIFAKAINTGIQRSCRGSGRSPQAVTDIALNAGLSTPHMGRESVEPIRHDARSVSRLKFWLGTFG